MAVYRFSDDLYAVQPETETQSRHKAQAATVNPAKRRMLCFCKSVFNCAAKMPIAKRLGSVPSEKANIYKAP